MSLRPKLPLASNHPLALALFLLLLLLSGVRHAKSECQMSDERCEFWLDVDTKLTMMHGSDAVYADHSQLYRYDVRHEDTPTADPVDPKDVIIADGYEIQTIPVIVINGTMPGPTIEVYEGQTVLVHVTNRMRSDAVTLHWHGMHQVGSPWMDGVAFVTQCPISPGQSFTYRFKAAPKGTFWYHSHMGSQLGMGLVGALIVREKKASQMGEHIMLLQEWNHLWDADVSFLRMQTGSFYNRIEIASTQSIDGIHFRNFLFMSGLINGRGRYFAETVNDTAQTPLTVYDVTHNSQYRFRVIGASQYYSFRVSVDDHLLKVMAADGYDLQPVEVESFIINPGERFDFVVEANQTVGNYWVRAQTLEVNIVNHIALAILRYEGAEEDDPPTRDRECTSAEKCLVFNCPFKYYPADENTVCLTFDDVNAAEEDKAPDDVDVEDIFLNFGFPGNSDAPASVNGVQFVNPPSPPLTQPTEFATRCQSNHECGEQKLCSCSLTIDLKHGKAYQFVFTNLGTGKGWAHAIHMHGHSFHVVKMGYPSYNPITGKFLADNPDIDCRGNVNANESFCNAPAWANGSWSGNTVPDLKLTWAPRKDTIMVPSGGYTVVRIRADNPGVWLLHSQVEHLRLEGMALLLNESSDRHPNLPNGFPKCGNFEYTGLTDDGTEDKDDKGISLAEDFDDCKESLLFWIIVGGLVGVALIELVIIACLLCLRRTKTETA